MNKNNNKIFCICSCGVDLQKGKTYQVVPDNAIDGTDFIRVIDDSGEDYLYPLSHFETIYGVNQYETGTGT